MKLFTEELRIFDQACTNRGNRAAQELVNVFGVATAVGIISQLDGVPPALHEELSRQIREAINEQKRRIVRP